MLYYAILRYTILHCTILYYTVAFCAQAVPSNPPPFVCLMGTPKYGTPAYYSKRVGLKMKFLDLKGEKNAVHKILTQELLVGGL